jgi:hypothetical protein
MRHYRVNYLDERGRVIGRMEFDCADDREAEEIAGQLSDDKPKELWRGASWVRSWPSASDLRAP